MRYEGMSRLPAGVRTNKYHVLDDFVKAIEDLDNKVKYDRLSKREDQSQRSLMDDSFIDSFGTKQDDFLRVAQYSTAALLHVSKQKQQNKHSKDRTPCCRRRLTSDTGEKPTGLSRVVETEN